MAAARKQKYGSEYSYFGKYNKLKALAGAAETGLRAAGFAGGGPVPCAALERRAIP